MKRVRHKVEKIRPEVAPTFDQQFWPVLVALGVVSSMAAGAIVTLLRGPWMWGSLLVLPAASVASIFLLYRLDDRRLRRSLQVALLTSLGLHLLMLVFAAATDIFGSSVRIPQVVATKQPEKRIVVSNRNQQTVMQQPRKFETPDSDVETEKTQATTTSQSQPVPLAEPQVEVNQPAVELRKQLPDVPRLEQQRAQRHRHHRPVTPQATPTNDVRSAMPRTTNQPTAAPSAIRAELRRPSENQRQTSEKQATVTAGSTHVGQIAATNQRRKTEPTQTIETARATARTRQSEVMIPRLAVDQSTVQMNTTATVVSSPTAQPRVDIAKSAAPSSALRKQTTSVPQPVPMPVAVPSAQRSIVRSEPTTPNSPTITTQRADSRSVPNTATVSVTPTTASVTPTTSASAKEPKRAAHPKSLAVARATGGIAGVGRSRNLERFTGGQPSPLSLASASSQRRQSSRLTESVSLSSLQRADKVGSGRAPSQQRVLKADSVEWTRRSGALVPADHSLQAAAANINASASNRAKERTSEKGESMLDMGAPKVVPEISANRRSGGGNPEVSPAIVRATQTAGGPRSSQSPRVQPAAEPTRSRAVARESAAVNLTERETETIQRKAVAESATTAKSRMRGHGDVHRKNAVH